MHGAGITIRHAALGGLRQTKNPQPHQYPEGQNKGPGHGPVRPRRRDQTGIDAFQRGNAAFHASAFFHDGQQHQHRGDQHHHALHGVGKRDSAETAQRGVQHNRHAEQPQSHNIRIPCHSLEQPRPADELGQHGRHEKDEQRG